MSISGKRQNNPEGESLIGKRWSTTRKGLGESLSRHRKDHRVVAKGIKGISTDDFVYNCFIRKRPKNLNCLKHFL